MKYKIISELLLIDFYASSSWMYTIRQLFKNAFFFLFKICMQIPLEGWEFRVFLWSFFSFLRNFAIWEVPRNEEFSPLKNADTAKSETPTTCKQDISALHTKWLENAGAIFEENSENADSKCEVSPLVSYNGEVRRFVSFLKVKSKY